MYTVYYEDGRICEVTDDEAEADFLAWLFDGYYK